jgi:hypothetical protein
VEGLVAGGWGKGGKRAGKSGVNSTPANGGEEMDLFIKRSGQQAGSRGEEGSGYGINGAFFISRLWSGL